MKKFLFFLYLCVFSLFAPPGFGRSIEALFHPFDPSLERISAWIKGSDASIDIAMYSLDFSSTNPVIEALQSPIVQRKVQAGTLKIRMIYEGYGGRDNALAMSRELEELGIDVRFLASGRKVHHKFAVFDYGQDLSRLVSGSANWSMTSYRNYNESVLFIENEAALIQAFQREFNLLWDASEKVGEDLLGDFHQEIEPILEQEGAKALFNSSNFIFAGLSLAKNDEAEGYTLTREIVRSIDQAQNSIKIATTRIQLRAVYDALTRAAARGLIIQIVVNMDQYAFKDQRSDWTLSLCPDPYERSCSIGINSSFFLSEWDFPGKERISLRIKFTDLDPGAFLSKQMHSKYIVVDDRFILSGSFNWSYSGEYNHLENLISFDGTEYPDAGRAFLLDFQRLYELGRAHYLPLLSRLEQAFIDGQKIDCRFEPMSLTFSEIDYLLDTGVRHHAALHDACLD